MTIHQNPSHIGIASSAQVSDQTPASRLQEKLPVLPKQVALAMQNFFTHVRVTTTSFSQDMAYWRFETKPPTLPDNTPDIQGEMLVELSGSKENLILMLTKHQWQEQRLPLPWWEYSDAKSKLLAWELAHEKLLSHLNLLFDDAFSVTAIDHKSRDKPESVRTRTPQQCESEIIYLSWKAIADNLISYGHLGILYSGINRLLSENNWPKEVAGYRPVISDITTTGVALVLVTEPITLQELSAFEAGDLFYLGNKAKVQSALRIFPCHNPYHNSHHDHHPDKHQTVDLQRAYWSAIYQPSENTRETPSAVVTKELSMETISDSNMNATSATTTVKLNELPINIEFKLGQLQVPLSQIQDIQPGYIFNLENDIENSIVDIMANGSLIGQGRLVAIEDHLGIQVLQIGSAPEPATL